jgi:TfoX/Sxy family transcriptional regulator of competence genes
METYEVTEKKMFGGIAFMVNGNMTVGVVKDELMVRVGKEAYQKALKEDFTREMDFTGKPLRGMIFVETEGLSEDENLHYWIKEGLTFTQGLPEK